MVGADGEVRWVRDRGRVRREDGRCFLDGSILDVTAIRRAQEELEVARAEAHRLAHVDPLTELANRRSLPAQLAALDPARPLGVLSVDVDHFKSINDLRGHAAGDAVLVALAQRLRNGVREGDQVFRLGGEEFLVLLAGVHDEPALLAAAQALRARLARDPIATAEGEPLAITVSVGAALHREGGDHATALTAADRALYAAKRRGRDRVELATTAPGEDVDEADDSDTPRIARAMAAAAALATGRDPRHAQAVSLLAARLARRLGAPRAAVMRCRVAGLLSGLGRREPEALIAAAPQLGPVTAILRHAGERYEARGEAIPLEVRIVAAAAAWVRATSEPPARPRGRARQARAGGRDGARPAGDRGAARAHGLLALPSCVKGGEGAAALAAVVDRGVCADPVLVLRGEGDRRRRLSPGRRRPPLGPRTTARGRRSWPASAIAGASAPPRRGAGALRAAPRAAPAR